MWEDPAAFDLRREVKPHLAFSQGVHVCLGAWVAKAEVATVGLPALFGRLRGLDLMSERPPEIGGWVFRGMLNLSVTWTGAGAVADPVLVPETVREPDAAPSVAIVGSGPAGSFTAQAVRRAFPKAQIDVFDRLPVPYGLVRYGVAADHQGTKSVARQFDRLFTREGVRFHGNVTLGGDLDVTSLRKSFDAVVLATGLREDAALSIPGAGLDGVIGAGRLTRALNGHPDEAAGIDPLGADVVVVGHGNVAVDVVRLLTRDPAGFDGSDIDDAVRDHLVGGVRVVHVVGRSMPSTAKFDPVMVRELAGIPGVGHLVHGIETVGTSAGKDARVDAVRELAQRQVPDPRVRVEWWFGLTPAAMEATGRLHAARFTTATGDEVTLHADTVVTAVGFAASDDTPVAAGVHDDGRVEPGLYVAGWLRRGPRGTIPDQRNDAREFVRLLREDIAAGVVTTGGPGRDALPALPDAVDFDGWRRIDLRETMGAAPGRIRAKLRTREELLEAARDVSLMVPEAVTDADSNGAAVGVPVTIVFGTESGGAELVAEDLRRRLDGRADIQVVDLSETDPHEIDPSRLHIVVCSTYGDGELPTSVRPFREALLEERPDLSDLPFAVFGMGDRSYSKTYSRGSELLAEALTQLGATRVGEYGRHDAGGPLDAVEAAGEWLEGVLAEIAARVSVTQ